MKTNFVATFLVVLFSVNVNALNILAIFPYQGKSHFIVFKVLLQELANRGHDITVISHFPEKEPLKNYHDISLAGTLKDLDVEVPLERSFMTVMWLGLWLANSGKENCEVMLANQQVQDLVKKKRKFDVVLVEQFNSDCALGVAYKLGAPVVATTSHVLMPFHFARFGIPSNPSFVSFHFLEGGTKPSLFQRIERVTMDAYLKTVYYWITQRSDQKTLEKYFGETPPLEELGREIKFLLLYQNFALTSSKLQPANVIEVGGYHVAKPGPLTGNLKKFVEESAHGVIYISFGTTVKSSMLPPEKLQAILDAISELPQRFIWKWNNDTEIADKNKVYCDSWLPQVDILGHPKTVAFFSHAGLGGTTEALYSGVPIVAMPLFGDQPSNAAAIEASGIGVQIQYSDLNKDNLVAAFKKVLDPNFHEKAKEVSATWHDRPMTPLDTAVFWIEFVARHPSLSFRSAAADVPFYQYFLLDVIGVFIAFAIAVAFVLIKVLSLCCGKRNVRKVQKKSKRA